MRLSTLEHKVHFLTAPSVLNPHCYTEKRLWIEKYIGIEACNNLIIANDKSMIMGDYLIDDKDQGRGQEGFTGQLIHFASDAFPDWPSVIHFFNQLSKPIPKVVELECHDGHLLALTFEDGLKGTYSIEDKLWGEVFSPLKDMTYFKQAFIDSFGVITWPNDADLAPDVVYASVLKDSKRKRLWDDFFTGDGVAVDEDGLFERERLIPSHLTVGEITETGFALSLGESEYFLAYEDFPELKDKTEEELKDVVQLSSDHFSWGLLDIDLRLKHITHPHLGLKHTTHTDVKKND